MYQLNGSNKKDYIQMKRYVVIASEAALQPLENGENLQI